MFSKLFDFNTTENNKYFLTQKEKFLEKEKTMVDFSFLELCKRFFKEDLLIKPFIFILFIGMFLISYNLSAHLQISNKDAFYLFGGLFILNLITLSIKFFIKKKQILEIFQEKEEYNKKEQFNKININFMVKLNQNIIILLNFFIDFSYFIVFAFCCLLYSLFFLLFEFLMESINLKTGFSIHIDVAQIVDFSLFFGASFSSLLLLCCIAYLMTFSKDLYDIFKHIFKKLFSKNK